MVLLSFFDGTTFFVGLAMVLAGGLTLLATTHRQARRIAISASVIGVVLVIVSAVSLPLWAYGVWVIGVLWVLMRASRPNGEYSRCFRRLGVSVLATVTIGMTMFELPHHLAPRVQVSAGCTVYVVGDSLSAGIGRNERCWPEVLSGRFGIPVVNLAMGGATAQTALAQAEFVDRSDSVVLVEIGGNDLLGGTSAADFRWHLDKLLAALHAHGHRLVMFELPLYPFRNAFGAAQRELAAQYDVALIPKRYLTRVIGLTDGTLDGLHFSQKGHDAMADALAKMLVREAGEEE
jgi:acyl-CoA thioesterase-1